MKQWLCVLFAGLTLFCSSFVYAVDESNSIKKKTVKLATSDWYPYVGEKLPDYGYVSDVVATAFRNAGYGVDIKFMSWADALKLDQLHNDAYFPAYDTDADDTVACPIPLQAGPIGLYKRKNEVIQYTITNPGKNQEAAFQGLKKYRFGAVIGYGNTKDFDEATYLKKIETKDDYDNLKQLQDGKVDLAITDVFVAEYLIENYPEELSNIEFMGPSLENKKFIVCFSKQNPDYPQLLSDFNIAMKQLLDSGEYDKIIAKHGN